MTVPDYQRQKLKFAHNQETALLSFLSDLNLKIEQFFGSKLIEFSTSLLI